MATAGSAVLGPAVASCTAALVSDTAVPAWHEGHREMPYLFVGAGAAGGLGLLVGPERESGPARNFAVLGAALEAGATKLMERRLGLVGEPYGSGKGGSYLRAAGILSAAGVTGAVWGRLEPRTAPAPVRSRPRRRLGRDPMGHLPRRQGLRERPEVRRRGAASAVARIDGKTLDLCVRPNDDPHPRTTNPASAAAPKTSQAV